LFKDSSKCILSLTAWSVLGLTNSSGIKPYECALSASETLSLPFLANLVALNTPTLSVFLLYFYSIPSTTSN
jgi:hypothetical protein